ncbi:MAG: NUDIX domain-containing protein, partial [Lentisphaerota bacterium]
MPHLHERYDFVVSVFIVHRARSRVDRDRVLLINHKRYSEWLPIGGHIELDEDPEEALYREIREECGLKIRLLNRAPGIAHRGVKPLPTPSYVDAHRISKTHSHIAFVFFAVCHSDKTRLHEEEHSDYRWVSSLELND